MWVIFPQRFTSAPLVNALLSKSANVSRYAQRDEKKFEIVFQFILSSFSRDIRDRFGEISFVFSNQTISRNGKFEL